MSKKQFKDLEKEDNVLPANESSHDSNNKSKKKPKEPSISLVQLFRFSTPKERLLILCAIICSAATGAIQPVSILIYGTFISNLTEAVNDPSKLVGVILPVVHTMAYLGTAALVAAYVSTSIWILTGENQARRIRSLYLQSVLRQDMSWFDTATDDSLNTRLADDTQIIQDGISEKFGLFISFFAQFVGGYVVAFIKGWQMALVLLVSIPLLAGTGATMSIFLTKYTKEEQDASAEAGSIAEQAFQSIRTVTAFSLQNRFVHRYNKKLDKAYTSGVKGGISLGCGFAFLLFFMFCTYGLALWFGSRLVTQGHLSGPSVFVVFLAMMLGSMSFVKLPPNMSAISSARGAAYKVFSTIDRVPDINVDASDGLKPTQVRGAIDFKNVNFAYPTRPSLPILKNVSFHIQPGTTVAFVGRSGSGKSTIVQLIQRFYDTKDGGIFLDGLPLKNLNVRWLRQQIGVVSQEPVLFNMTIRQNLLLGADGPVSEETLIHACEEANCHSFISRLPKGYDTIVGEQGTMLSGGQKQRIAIARAILKNPSLLLLDEATSALDTTSERLVQNALDKASKNRTTIIVAHRLSTVMKADLIVVLDHGNIIEQGTHSNLSLQQGVYAGLVEKQAIDIEKKLQINTDEKQPQLLFNELDTIATLNSNQGASDKQSVSTISLSNDQDSLIDAYDIKLKKDAKLKKEMSKIKAPVLRVVKDMKPEWGYLALGLFGAAISGCVFPLYAYSFSYVVVILSIPGQEIQPSPLGGTNLYAFLFAILAIVAFLGGGLQMFSFELSGKKYTRRLREKVFRTYLKQEIGFFDQEENSIGAITTKLAVDSRNVNEMITKVWGDIANITVTFVVGLIIAFTHSWALTLITLCMAPFLFTATAYEFYLQRGFEDSTKSANAQSGQIAGEAIREVRTVAALNKQTFFECRYCDASAHPHKLAIRKAYLSSLGSACSKGISIYTNALSFYAGARLVANGSIDFQQMFTSMLVIITAAETAGRSSTFAASFTKAKHAAISCFELIDRKLPLDPDLEGMEPSNVRGEISFERIKFAYPTRSEIPIFNGAFNLHVKQSKTIALVGPSGCGKSTVISMLERWYDPLGGQVSLDNHHINSYSLHNLRSHMALVGQEPVLFDMSISENIRYGVDENTRVTQDEMEQVCKAANIHTFISELPQGYDTRVGDKGSQLSGGQKQRISIARALLRKDKVLLLDEATSALDSDSEKLVQEALDNIIHEGGRTIITIAHRLSTIKNADLICVIKEGRVVEQGTHFELLRLNGEYTNMVHQQSLDVVK